MSAGECVIISKRNHLSCDQLRAINIEFSDCNFLYIISLEIRIAVTVRRCNINFSYLDNYNMLFSWSSVKDGLCPRASPYGPCVVTCGADEDCDGSQKCCSNGCGAWCLEPSKN